MLHAKNLSEDEKDPDNEAIGIAHPRALQISQRELIVRQGMGDREPQVRVAASKLLVTWLEVAADAATKQHDNVEHDVIAFLRMFDLGAGSIAEDALSCIFADRPDILDALAFSGTFIIRTTCYAYL
jgi:condensin complex subunit 3